MLHPVVPFADVPELHAHPVLQRQSATQAQEETEFIRPLCQKVVQGNYDDTMIDQEISKVGGCLIIDAKGVFDAIHQSESAALSMQDKKICCGRSCFERGDWKKQNPAAMVSQRSVCL